MVVAICLAEEGEGPEMLPCLYLSIYLGNLAAHTHKGIYNIAESSGYCCSMTNGDDFLVFSPSLHFLYSDFLRLKFDMALSEYKKHKSEYLILSCTGSVMAYRANPVT